MKRGTIVSIIIGIALLVVGAVIFLISLAAMKFSFKGLETGNYTETTHNITESFDKIKIETSTADITFIKSDNGECTVVCNEDKEAKHKVRVSGDTLEIIEPQQNNIRFFNVNFGSTSVVVSLPGKEYEELKISSSTGDINVPSDFEFEDVKIKVSTADITFAARITDNAEMSSSTGHINVCNLDCSDAEFETSTGGTTLEDSKISSSLKIKASTGKNVLKNVECKKLEMNASTGKTELTSVLVSKEMHIKAQTGAVVFDGCDAEEIYVKTSTGSVKGTLLTDKVFITKSDTGDIDVPKSITGGRCEITTDTGDIRISIK